MKKPDIKKIDLALDDIWQYWTCAKRDHRYAIWLITELLADLTSDKEDYDDFIAQAEDDAGCDWDYGVKP